MIADLQPLIKFELYSDQIDDATFSEQSQQQTLQPVQEVQEEVQQVKKTNSRRRTIRPSLSTISEDFNETLGLPPTPGSKAGSPYKSPTKQWSAVTDKLKTPTKVAESPLKNFTIAATPEAGKIEITNQRGDLHITSPTSAEITTDHSEAGVNGCGDLHIPSPSATGSTTYYTIAAGASPFKTTTENSHGLEVAVFDQPADQVRQEPEHESKRCVSLNNARRSDRRSDTKVLKRVTNWITSKHTANRRHSDISSVFEKSGRSHRRHTLDVDVGRNLDIFGQSPLRTVSHTEDQAAEKENDILPEQTVEQTAQQAFDLKFEEVKQKLAKRKHAPALNTKVGCDIEIDEEILKAHETPRYPRKWKKFESPKKSVPDIEIPWDDFKLFAGINITSATNATGNITPSSEDNDRDEVIPEDTVPTATETASGAMGEVGASVSGAEDMNEQGMCDEELSVEMDTFQEIDCTDSNVVDEPTKEPLSKVRKGGNQQEQDAAQIDNKADVPLGDFVMIDEDKENAEDDSALAMLHNFVRRVQTSKEGKRSDGRDFVSILPPQITKKRRSSSMNSATSDSGSPMTRFEVAAATPSPRKPLEAKDTNKSPSPSKKRKLGETEDAPLNKKSGRLTKPDLEDIEPSKPKKRRRRMESDTDDIFNPDMDLNQVLTQKGSGVSRRSNRIAVTKSTKTSVPSTIPVRFPGSSGMLQDPDMPAVSTSGITNAVIQRKAEKDLATETRTNTRKNKGGAMAVPIALVVLAQQTSEDSSAGTPVPKKSIRPGGNKSVRWDTTLTRVQGEEVGEVTAVVVTEEQPVGGEEEENLPSPPQLRSVKLSPDRPAKQAACQLDEPASAPAVIAVPVQPEPEKKQPPRRSTRSSVVSRLPTRSPGSAATPKKSPLPDHPRIKPGRSSTGAASAVAGRLGTPAPKRRGARR